MNKKTRIFAYSAIATSLIFGSLVISGCGDSGSTTPAFPNSSTSTPSTDPTPNDPNTPNTPSTPSTPDNPDESTPNPTPDQPAEEEGRQISLQFGAQSAAELANLKITKARYLVAKDLDDGQEKLMEGSLNLDSEAKEMTIKDVPEEANTITCFYYNDEGKVAAASHTRLKRNQAQTQSALSKVALGKLTKVETEEVETTIHSVKDATWELKSDKDKAVKDEYITYTLKLITADNTVIDNVIGLTDQSIEIPQIDGKDCLVPDTIENVVGRYKLVDAGDNGVGVIVRIDTDGGVQYIVPKYEVFLASNDYLWEFSYNSQDSTVATPSTVFLKLSTCRASYEVDEATSPRRDYVKFIKNFDFYPNAQKNYVFNFQDTPLEYVSANCMATALLAEDRIKEIIGSSTIGTIVSLKPYEENESYMQNCGSYYYRGKSSEVYNISHILSFAFAENSSGKKVYSGSSGELAARGVGSFILSALISSGYPCMEGSKGEKDFASFEEAFNDILALYMSSQDINACRLAISQCQGDWKKTNCLAAIGEELGQYNGKDCARLLINDYKWSEEGRSSSDYSLSDYQEWALIFSGAYYDVMTGIAQRNIDAGMDSAIALKEAGQEAMELLVKGLIYSENSYHGPITGVYDSYIYRKMAIAMLKVDAKDNGCRAKDIITKVMRARNILQEGDDASTILPYQEPYQG